MFQFSTISAINNRPTDGLPNRRNPCERDPETTNMVTVFDICNKPSIIHLSCTIVPAASYIKDKAKQLGLSEVCTWNEDKTRASATPRMETKTQKIKRHFMFNPVSNALVCRF